MIGPVESTPSRAAVQRRTHEHSTQRCRHGIPVVPRPRRHGLREAGGCRHGGIDRRRQVCGRQSRWPSFPVARTPTSSRGRTPAQRRARSSDSADVTFNETAGWDQTKQNDVLKSLAAQGYNAFGIFGVSPDNINSTFSDLERQGFHGRLAGLLPGGQQQGRLLSVHRRAGRGLQGCQGRHRGHGRSGQPRPPDRQQGRLEHPAPHRGRAEGGGRDGRQGQAAPDRHRHRHRPADRAAGRRRPAGGQGQGRSTAIVTTAYNPAVAPRRCQAGEAARSRWSPSTTTRPSSRASRTARSPATVRRTRSGRPGRHVRTDEALGGCTMKTRA